MKNDFILILSLARMVGQAGLFHKNYFKLKQGDYRFFDRGWQDLEKKENYLRSVILVEFP